MQTEPLPATLRLVMDSKSIDENQTNFDLVQCEEDNTRIYGVILRFLEDKRRHCNTGAKPN